MVKYKHTANFQVGELIPTRLGNTYTVKSIERKGEGEKDVYYNLECNFCIKDKLLYPPTHKILKSNLLKGFIPCGCGKQYRWSKSQYLLRVERKCKEVNLRLLGHGKWDTYKTVVRFECKYHRTHFTSSIDHFLRYLKGCPDCVSIFNKSRKDKVSIDGFFESGKFPKGTVFSRNVTIKDSNGYYNSWDVKCGTCSKDELTLSGVCSGVFTIKDQSLKRGNLPCRCSSCPRLNKGQKEFKIRTLLKEEGHGDFMGWKTSYKKSDGLFTWVCKGGHQRDTRYSNFVNKGDRCAECNPPTFNGFFSTRLEEKDTLYVIRLPNGEGKIGRTFQLKARLKSIKTAYKTNEYSKQKPEQDFEVLFKWDGIHSKVFTIEQYILSILEEKELRLYKNWTTETFKEEAWDYVLSEVNRLCK